LHQAVKGALIDRALSHQLQALRSKIRVVRKRLVYRIGIDAPDRYPFSMAEILSQQGRHKTLPDASFSLQ
jgi:hypothetical protein